MDLLGVGPLELIFILLIIFLVVGPNDMAATGKKIGRFLSTMRKSEFWRGVTQVTKEMRDLPTTLMREAEFEETKKELQKDFKDIKQISQEFGLGELREIKQELESGIPLDDHKIAPPALEETKPETKKEEEVVTEDQEDSADA
jgi:Sec-independent protein translocase protein TatA